MCWHSCAGRCGVTIPADVQCGTEGRGGTGWRIPELLSNPNTSTAQCSRPQQHRRPTPSPPSPASPAPLTDFAAAGVERRHHVLLGAHQQLLGALRGLQRGELQLPHVLLPPAGTGSVRRARTAGRGPGWRPGTHQSNFPTWSSYTAAASGSSSAHSPAAMAALPPCPVLSPGVLTPHGLPAEPPERKSPESGARLRSGTARGSPTHPGSPRGARRGPRSTAAPCRSPSGTARVSARPGSRCCLLPFPP